MILSGNGTKTARAAVIVCWTEANQTLRPRPRGALLRAAWVQIPPCRKPADEQTLRALAQGAQSSDARPGAALRKATNLRPHDRNVFKALHTTTRAPGAP